MCVCVCVCFIPQISVLKTTYLYFSKCDLFLVSLLTYLLILSKSNPLKTVSLSLRLKNNQRLKCNLLCSPFTGCLKQFTTFHTKFEIYNRQTKLYIRCKNAIFFFVIVL